MEDGRPLAVLSKDLAAEILALPFNEDDGAAPSGGEGDGEDDP
jgi:hypothetical protein